ncbi:hypothetical protein ACFX1Z_019321 [Malus domestica]
MPKGRQCKVSLHLVRLIGKDIKPINVHKEIGVIIQLLCGGNLKRAQHEGYWQPYEEFYSRPMQYAQSNSSSSIDYNQILNELNSLVQGSQNQAKEAQQDAYW